MIWLPLQTLAQVSVERVLNALPEGMLVALFAWGLLRVLRRQNSGTRFAVWFVALLMVAGLPLLGGFAAGRAGILAVSSTLASSGSVRPAIAIPGSWALVIFLAWVVGAGALLARLAAGMWRLRQLGRSCTPVVAADLDPALQEAMNSITASGVVTVATSERVRVPAAIGFWKRTIVLPAWVLRELAANDLRAILLHEFAHLRRRDDWSNLVQKTVRAVFFFHPAVWWIESRLSVEREMACDDAVLAETANPRGYASCLVSLLEKSMAHRLSPRLGEKHWSMAHAAVRRAHEASLRLSRILDARRSTATRIWKPALGAMGIFSLLSLAALPHAPQLVAFDRGTAQVETAPREMGALGSPSRVQLGSGKESSPVVAAAMATAKDDAERVGFATSAAKAAGENQVVIAALKRRATKNRSFSAAAKVVPTPAVAGLHPDPAQPAPVSAAGLNAAPPAPAVAINAKANQESVPQIETVVFIEATQYNASLWRIEVWRVTLLVRESDRAARVPVVNSI